MELGGRVPAVRGVAPARPSRPSPQAVAILAGVHLAAFDRVPEARRLECSIACWAGKVAMNVRGDLAARLVDGPLGCSRRAGARSEGSPAGTRGLWPSIRCRAKTSPPFARKAVANLWRRTSGEQRFRDAVARPRGAEELSDATPLAPGPPEGHRYAGPAIRSRFGPTAASMPMPSWRSAGRWCPLFHHGPPAPERAPAHRGDPR